MILTPTYHVFEMFKAHQNGQLLESYVESKEIGIGESKVVNLTESVSKDKDGNIHITMNNLSLDETYSIESIILNKNIRSVRSV